MDIRSAVSANVSGILCVGLVCLDIVNVCDQYPREDEDVRAAEQRWEKGGNAANSLAVLAQLGVSCDFHGTVGSGPETEFVLSDMKSYGVGIELCVCHEGKKLPTTTAVVSRENGSRTIVHYRDLPELTVDDFKTKISLHHYKWIHFEGRNVIEVQKMIDAIDDHNKLRSDANEKIKVSLELEKSRPELLSLFHRADVVFVSKDFARYQNCQTAHDAVQQLGPKLRCKAKLVIAWGEMGAYAVEKNTTSELGKFLHSPAYPPLVIVDTLAAGDTFNAAVIYSLFNGNSLHDALTFGCQLAGIKCGQQGQRGIVNKMKQSGRENQTNAK